MKKSAGIALLLILSIFSIHTVCAETATDIVLNNIHWTPENPKLDDRITVLIDITNNGDETVYADLTLNVQYIIGTPFILRGISFGPHETKTISSDQMLSATGGNPAVISYSEGDYDVGAEVDLNSGFADTNSDNNRMGKMIHVEYTNLACPKHEGSMTNSDLPQSCPGTYEQSDLLFTFTSSGPQWSTLILCAKEDLSDNEIGKFYGAGQNNYTRYALIGDKLYPIIGLQSKDDYFNVVQVSGTNNPQAITLKYKDGDKICVYGPPIETAEINETVTTNTTVISEKNEAAVSECIENDVKKYTCSDGVNVSWCACLSQKWNCTSDPLELCKKAPTCNGCLQDNVCLPIGIRSGNEYCSSTQKMLQQKNEGNSCENNFECTSNVCISGKCVSMTLIQKIINWFKNLFGM